MKNTLTVIRVVLWRFVRRIEKRLTRRQRIMLAISKHRGRFSMLPHRPGEAGQRWIRNADRLLALNARWFQPNATISHAASDAGRSP